MSYTAIQKRGFSVLFLLLLGACDAGLSFNASLDTSQLGVRGNTYGASDVGSKALQRLGKVEYNNSVHDLTGTSLTPADDFPADEISNNFDNIADVLSVSPSLIHSYAAAAISLGDEVTQAASDDKLKTAMYFKVAPCAKSPSSSASCLSETAKRFGLRAWRRPLSSSEVASLVSIGQTAGNDLPTQVGAVVTAALTSPYFLFRVESDGTSTNNKAHALSPYELATRLSYFVWRSGPDDTLLESAANGALLGDDELKSQLHRMLADPRAQSLVTGFATRWLLLNQLDQITPDAATFPGYNDTVKTSMVQETQLFLRDFVLGGDSLSTLLTANHSYLNDTLANYYGVPAPNSSTPVKTTWPQNSQRLGLLTQGSVLTVGSTGATTSPIRRGKLIIAQLLCASPPPPPANIPALPSEEGTNMTLRQALGQHTSNPACSSCHINMDDLGFAYEGFDGAGKVRTSDNNQPIDATGKYFQMTPFNGAAELAPLVSGDPRFGSCTSQMLYSYALGRTLLDSDAPVIAGLAQELGNKQMSLTALMEAIVLSAPFRSRHG